MELRYLRQRKSVLDFERTRTQWDIYISAYNDSQRVQRVFDKVCASRKYWVMIPEYNYSLEDYPLLGDVIPCSSGASESEVVSEIAKVVGSDQLRSSKVCIDITGFMRPQIIYLIRYLSAEAVTSISLLYTEPAHYALKENTRFSDEAVEAVRQVLGFEGIHDDDMSNDVLIVGVGYDHALVSHVIDDRDSAKLIRLLSLPS